MIQFFLCVFILLLSEAFSEFNGFRSRIIDVRIRSGSEWEIFRNIISFDLRQTFQYVRLPIDRAGCVDFSILVSVSGKLIDGVIFS